MPVTILDTPRSAFIVPLPVDQFSAWASREIWGCPADLSVLARLLARPPLAGANLRGELQPPSTCWRGQILAPGGVPEIRPDRQLGPQWCRATARLPAAGMWTGSTPLSASEFANNWPRVRHWCSGPMWVALTPAGNSHGMCLAPKASTSPFAMVSPTRACWGTGP
jgi:hypothetical protein